MATLDPTERRTVLERYTADQLAALRYDWRFWRRPDQEPPPDEDEWVYWLVRSGRGFGKMLSLGTPIPTPSGWSTMGEVKAGDEVFDEGGRPCRVVWTSPVQFGRTYRIRFSDRSSLIACGDHQWVTWTHDERKVLLRSAYVTSRDRFPEDWPVWRNSTRRGGNSVISPERVLEAVEAVAAGLSQRRASIRYGICREALVKHVSAGGYAARQPPRLTGVGPQIRTTDQIASTLCHGARGDRNHCIPQALPLELPERALPVDPYLLGLWLGDGSSRDGTLTAHESDHIRIVSEFARIGIKATTARCDPQRITTFGFATQLRLAGLLKNKHVPLAYLRSSPEQRLALLQGLMDSDGGVEGGSTVAFGNANKALTDAVYELVVSLGMRATEDSRVPSRPGAQRSYRTTFTPTVQVFRLPRKADCLSFDCAQMLRRRHRMIVAVEEISPVAMRCITVDSPNSMYLAGRAMIPTHNTRLGAEWARSQAEAGIGPGALIGATEDEVRRVMLDGESGIMSISPPWFRPSFEPSVTGGRVTWPNGVVAYCYSAANPEGLRGPNIAWAWLDEPAKWRLASRTFEQLEFTLRAGPHPRAVLTTTPRPIPLIRRLLADPNCRVTSGSSYANRANLAPVYYQKVIARHEGQRLGRQEIHGEVLDDVEGALWTLDSLDNARCRPEDVPDTLDRVVVGVDPSGTDGGADEASRHDDVGIVVVGRSGTGNSSVAYVLEDGTCSDGPEAWGRRVVSLYRHYRADRIVAEANFGGAMVKFVIDTAARQMGITLPPVEMVNSSRGKAIRADPVSVLYGHREGEYWVGSRVRHVVESDAEYFRELEDEMLNFSRFGYLGDHSPNRADALVFAMTDLMLGEQSPSMWSVDDMEYVDR